MNWIDGSDWATDDIAYTRYAFFEWGLIFFDVLYDSIAERDFAEADLKVCPSFSLYSIKGLINDSDNHWAFE